MPFDDQNLDLFLYIGAAVGALLGFVLGFQIGGVGGGILVAIIGALAGGFCGGIVGAIVAGAMDFWTDLAAARFMPVWILGGGFLILFLIYALWGIGR